MYYYIYYIVYIIIIIIIIIQYNIILLHVQLALMSLSLCSLYCMKHFQLSIMDLLAADLDPLY